MTSKVAEIRKVIFHFGLGSILIWKDEVTIVNLVFEQKRSHKKNIINKYPGMYKKISSKLECTVLHYCPSLVH